MATNESGYVGMLSPDGSWRWTGAAWEPVPGFPVAPRDRRVPGQSLPTPVLMTLVGLAVVFFFGVVAVLVAQDAENDAGRESHRVYCERWADENDPDCP